MLVIHEVVSQAGATIRDSTIGELEVELPESRGCMDDKESVEETYGSISVTIRMRILTSQVLHLPESRQRSKEGYKCNQRHRHCKYDNGARERHGERKSRFPMRRIVG
jgi:hypothetical protein